MNITYETLNDGRIAISPEDFEDMMDIIAYDETKVRKDEELFPIELTERLINGENALRIYREYRGFTQTQLAAKVNLTQATIAELEKGKQKGSIETWKALSHILNVDINELV
jgi:DNA-binding XRE family transcriptional regulator